LPAPRRLNGHEAVLVVEDEDAIRSLLVSALGRYGYRVLSARDGIEALERARTETSLDLVVTDVRMPGMTGAELAEAVQLSHPGIPVIFMSGYMDADLAVPCLPGAHSAFLKKPFTPSTLAAQVREALNLRSAHRSYLMPPGEKAAEPGPRHTCL
jgi:two-component system cell cycle sensor histidine kinase/response regulator CckA